MVIQAKDTPQLGGSKPFHQALKRESCSRRTYKAMNDIRAKMMMHGCCPLHQTKVATMKQHKNMPLANSASCQPSVYKRIQMRVQSGDSHRIRPFCVRQLRSTPVNLSQSCEVLGHHACRDCIQVCKQQQYYLEIANAYPYIEVNQRLAKMNSYPERGPRSFDMTLPSISGTSTGTLLFRMNSHPRLTNLRKPRSEPGYGMQRQLLRDTRITSHELHQRVMKKNKIEEWDTAPVSSSTWDETKRYRYNTVDHSVIVQM